jgi:GNAT superfamily N-acetyltransferase
MEDKIIYRHATQGDTKEFLRLWLEMLKEHHSLGSEILPTERNLFIYGFILNKYLAEPSKGVALVAEYQGALVGVLMWGDAESPFELAGGPLAQGWGTYVHPEARRHHVGARLRHQGLDELRGRGFKKLSGTSAVGNEAGFESASRLPGARLHAVVCLIDLQGEG